MEREWKQYQHGEYQRLAGISVAQLHRLRQRPAYRQRRLHFTKTRPTPVSIGERRRPNPEGRPGYVRVDTVHQGDRDGVKGAYHINAVDEVTQWQVVGATSYISEAWLGPVLRAMLEQFPFRVRGFHSDNGSEFINQTVEKLLNKLLIEQTKSRPRRSNDNALVESKNGAVIRKHLGYAYSAAAHAQRLPGLLSATLQPLSELPSAVRQAELVTNAQGKPKRVYRRYANPLGGLPAVAASRCYLKPGQTMRPWLRSLAATAIPKRPAPSSKPNSNCSPVFSR